MESKILSVLLHDAKAWKDIQSTIEADDFSEYGQVILSQINDFYSNDKEASGVDVDILKSKLRRRYPQHAETLVAILDSLEPVSVPNVLSEYVEVRLHSLGQRISAALAVGKDSSDLRELMEEFRFLADKREEALEKDEDSSIYVGLDVDDIFEELDPSHLIQLTPPSLNDKVEGGVIRGHHIVIFARPETGKSMFVISLTAGFLAQGLRVLYVGNEDPAAQLRQRILSSVTGMNKRDGIAQPDLYKERARDNGYENLIFASLSPGSVSNVRHLVAKYKPDVLVVDQLRNLQTSKSLTKVESLEYIAQAMRNIAKEMSCVAVSVTQAGDSANGKLGLEMGDVDFSNTGIPSAADLMIGLGVNHEYEALDRRMLSLCKNKISGLHDQFPVEVDPKLSRVYDV